MRKFSKIRGDAPIFKMWPKDFEIFGNISKFKTLAYFQKSWQNFLGVFTIYENFQNCWAFFHYIYGIFENFQYFGHIFKIFGAHHIFLKMLQNFLQIFNIFNWAYFPNFYAHFLIFWKIIFCTFSKLAKIFSIFSKFYW